jgi:NADH dehydrogenase
LTEHGSKRIVILGAGVSGLRIALKLENRLGMNKNNIILIDENEYHQYLYRIHEVCNNHYEEKDIIVPLNRILKGKRVECVKASVIAIDPERRVVETSEGDQFYDILVITLGSHSNYFGIPGLEENSYTLGSYKQARVIRARIEEIFNKAEVTGQPPNILIGGGGFTGVELAGEIADWYPILCRQHNLEKPKKVLTIVEAMSTILPEWNADLIEQAQGVLESLGIELLFNDPITSVEEKRVVLKSGKVLEPDLFVWTGGVRGDPVCTQDFEIMSRRIITDGYNRIPGHEVIFAAGDCACAVDESGRPQSPTAHIAMVQGDLVAHNIFNTLQGSSLKKYKFERAGEIVTLGKTNAVGDLFGIKFTGFLAKFMKKVVHWWYLHSIGGFSLLLGR